MRPAFSTPLYSLQPSSQCWSSPSHTAVSHRQLIMFLCETPVLVRGGSVAQHCPCGDVPPPVEEGWGEVVTGGTLLQLFPLCTWAHIGGNMLPPTNAVHR